MCQWIGARLVWAVSNFIIFVCMAGTAVISLFSSRKYSDGIQHVILVNGTNRVAALVIFVVLGFPLAVSIFLMPVSISITFKECHWSSCFGFCFWRGHDCGSFVFGSFLFVPVFGFSVYLLSCSV